MKHALNLSIVLVTTLFACQQVEMEDSLTGGNSSSQKEMQAEAVSQNDLAEVYVASDLALTSDWIKNPEKGLYKHEEYWFRKEWNDRPWAVDSNGLPVAGNLSFPDGTLVFAEFYLRDYRQKELDNAAVNRINQIFEKIRAAGLKAIVRFAYTEDENVFPREANKTLMLKHIRKLAPCLQANSDVIYLMQAGFIGTWGEWYYTSNSEFSWSRSDSNASSTFGARAEVLTAMLDAVPGRYVAVRAPYYKRYHLYTKSGYSLNSYQTLSRPNQDGNDHYRVAFYNDVFMVDNADQQGTYPTTLDRNMWKDQSAFFPSGGETANSDATEAYMMNVNSYDPVSWMKQYHMSYLHQRTDSDLYLYWQNAGKEKDIKNVLGYRLWLSSLKINGTIGPGKTVNMIFSIKNNGAAPVVYKRPMKIVFIRNSDKKVTELASTTGSVSDYIYFSQNNQQTTSHGSTDYADIRRIGPDQYKYFTCQVTLPSSIASGDMIAIWLPDQDGDLRNRKEYSIRLANKQQGGFKWQNYADRDNEMAGFNTIYTFF